eukprot:11610233-Ditylum_brightwellii.AAC.1
MSSSSQEKQEEHNTTASTTVVAAATKNVLMYNDMNLFHALGALQHLACHRIQQLHSMLHRIEQLEDDIFTDEDREVTTQKCGKKAAAADLKKEATIL